MSIDYEACKCGHIEVYTSVSGERCCGKCFKALNKIVPIKPSIVDNTAYVVKDNNGWKVMINGIVKKSFSKYEDYASTEARAFAAKLNKNIN